MIFPIRQQLKDMSRNLIENWNCLPIKTDFQEATLSTSSQSHDTNSAENIESMLQFTQKVIIASLSSN